MVDTSPVASFSARTFPPVVVLVFVCSAICRSVLGPIGLEQLGDQVTFLTGSEMAAGQVGRNNESDGIKESAGVVVRRECVDPRSFAPGGPVREIGKGVAFGIALRTGKSDV